MSAAPCTCPCCERARLARQGKAEMAEAMLAPERDLLETSDNGMHAWVAYRLARKQKLPLPEWVLDYLDACYANLAAKGGTSSAEKIARNLKLYTKGGGPTARDRAITWRNDLVTIQRVRQRQAVAAAKGQKIDDLIFADVAEAATKAGVRRSPTTIRNIYYRHRPAAGKRTRRRR